MQLFGRYILYPHNNTICLYRFELYHVQQYIMYRRYNQAASNRCRQQHRIYYTIHEILAILFRANRCAGRYFKSLCMVILITNLKLFISYIKCSLRIHRQSFANSQNMYSLAERLANLPGMHMAER